MTHTHRLQPLSLAQQMDILRKGVRLPKRQMRFFAGPPHRADIRCVLCALVGLRLADPAAGEGDEAVSGGVGRDDGDEFADGGLGFVLVFRGVGGGEEAGDEFGDGAGAGG